MLRTFVPLPVLATMTLLLASCGFVSVQLLDPPLADAANSDIGENVDAGSGVDAGSHIRIVVTRSGPGSGAVASPFGLDCGTTCAIDVPLGTELLLSPSASTGSWFEGWGGDPCSGRGECRLTATANTTIDARFTQVPNRVFVSSETHDGNFAGLSGADERCGALAASAGLAGDWIAMLSTTAGASFARLSGSRGFIRVDDHPVADQSLSGDVWYPIRTDENGTDLGGVDTWAMNNGSADQCAAWTSRDEGETARGAEADRAWKYDSGGGEHGCDELRHFYCAERGKVVSIDPSPVTGRRSFVTNGAWLPGGGIASADSACAAEATLADLPGIYRALLATNGADALARLPEGEPWVRSDGIPLLPSIIAWRSAALFDVAPVFDAAGTPLSSHVLFTGASAFETPGTLATTCQNWMETTGRAPSTIRTWSTQTRSSGTITCASAQHLLCLQE